MISPKDAPSTGINPKVADAVTISYISGNPNIINASNSTLDKNWGGVGGDAPLPQNYPFTMFEYGWTATIPSNPGPGVSSGYYVGEILNELSACVLSSFSYCLEYVDYYNGTSYYCGSAKHLSSEGWQPVYYVAYIPFIYDLLNPPSWTKESSNSPIPFCPSDQQKNNSYLYYGLFYTYYWYAFYQGSLNFYFLVNGNIYNNPLPQAIYSFNSYNASAIEPESPGKYIAIGYENAYQTAFVAEGDRALNNYLTIFANNLPSDFIDGTFGYEEEYNGLPPVSYLPVNYPPNSPYLFISAGSGAGSGFMYLDWVIVTFGVPYEITI